MYRQGAIRAKAAGFDGVDVSHPHRRLSTRGVTDRTISKIQGSGGYLIQQFLDSTVNKRTDSWGGSVANRARFALSVVKSCIEVYGDSKSVAIKLMPQGGFNDVGMPESETRETYGYLVKELDKLDIGYIHLLRTSEEFQNASNSTLHVEPSMCDYLLKLVASCRSCSCNDVRCCWALLTFN
jgi:2,4-dienoyl-CoA reductase-like NADH-dependent reductase (Old Yellow Enzyme family)